MPEETLFSSERRQTRAEVADYLRTVADKLDAGGSMSFSTGSDSVTLEVPARPTFEVKAEREGTAPNTELSVEFELEWQENGDDEGDLTIE
jgi:amphi-Trp domain-containing protein